MRRPLTPALLAAAVTIGGVVALAAIVASTLAGSVGIAPGEVLGALLGRAQGGDADIVRSLRLPRALAGFAVGGLLALAGALLQVVLRNPLADPYVLGVSGGAAAAALAALLAGAGAFAGVAAFGGALGSTLIVFALAGWHLAERRSEPTRLLLTGVVVAAGWGALIALMLTLAPSAQVKGMLHWLIGDLAGASQPLVPLAALALATAVALGKAGDLNQLARGADHATALGVDVVRTASVAHLLAALAAAAAVMQAGSVGFVGLVVPHAVRLALGNDQRLLIPVSVLAGGALVVVADTVARTAFAPLQIPVGVITALIGVPAFLWLQGRATT